MVLFEIVLVEFSLINASQLTSRNFPSWLNNAKRRFKEAGTLGVLRKSRCRGAESQNELFPTLVHDVQRQSRYA